MRLVSGDWPGMSSFGIVVISYFGCISAAYLWVKVAVYEDRASWWNKNFISLVRIQYSNILFQMSSQHIVHIVLGRYSAPRMNRNKKQTSTTCHCTDHHQLVRKLLFFFLYLMINFFLVFCVENSKSTIHILGEEECLVMLTSNSERPPTRWPSDNFSCDFLCASHLVDELRSFFEWLRLNLD